MVTSLIRATRSRISKNEFTQHDLKRAKLEPLLFLPANAIEKMQKPKDNIE